MNNDGWGFLGAGTSDNRIAGTDLQHNRQKRNGEQLPKPVRKVTHDSESGGPMKEHMDHEMREHSPVHHHMEEEKHRHEEAMEHHKHHIEKHHSRHYNSQHGHDDYKY